MFGYLTIGKVTLFALEPLFPKLEPDAALSAEELRLAWEEVDEALQPGISLFVSVYGGFFSGLKTLGFQALQVGREPFVRLLDCIPSGKSGKGVRAARNQALRSGIEVEEWSHERLETNPAIQAEMQKVLRQWKSRNCLQLGSFLNTVDPFERMNMRRYFLARKSGGQLEGFLVATPIPARNSYFLEDLVLRANVSRGAGELLTLEAMTALAESRAEYASLGVISLTCITEKSAHELPPLANFALVTLPKYLCKIYNVNGLETFRKRFKPHLWENIFIALRNHPRSKVGDSRAWFLALTTLIRAFRPRLKLSWTNISDFFLDPFRKYPVSTTLALIFTASFTLINRGGEIPESVLYKFGFSAAEPRVHRVYLTFTSDFLFFNVYHYASMLLLMLLVIRWAERSYPKKFVMALVACGIMFDDLVNQIVIIEPYKFLKHRIFESLVAATDIGPSLWITMVLGLVLCQLRKYREIAFAVISLFVVLGLAITSARMYMLVLNLNHFLFFCIGFITGKFYFEYERRESRKVAQQKPPVAKCVAAPRAPTPPKKVVGQNYGRRADD